MICLIFECTCYFKNSMDTSLERDKTHLKRKRGLPTTVRGVTHITVILRIKIDNNGARK